MRTATSRMTVGVTQRPSRRCEHTSVKVGHKPQEGWCLWFATGGNTGSSVIETLQRASDGPAPSPERISRCAPLAGSLRDDAREENGGEPFVTGEQKALERRPGRVSPCRSRKVPASERTRWNPMSAARMKQASQGFRRSKTSRG